MINRTVAAACALLYASAALAPAAARADVSENNALRAGLLAPANAALQHAMAGDSGSLDPKDVAQANPVGTPQAPIHRPSLPQGFTYNVDVSVAKQFGNLNFTPNIPGGMDAGFGYAFSRTNRVQVGYYEIQQTPVGYSNKNVPLYLQGLNGPGTFLPGAGIGTVNTGLVDNSTKDKILTFVDQNLFTIELPNKMELPIVISPTYLAHWATIGGRSDFVQFEYNGYPTEAHARTEQEYLLPVTLPFLATPRMFGTLTVAPQWLVHMAGVNETNHAQIFSLLYLEYRADRRTTVFFQPSRLPQYDPVFAYPDYDWTFIEGFAHKFSKNTFVQGTFLGGGPSNKKDLGINALTCQRLGGPAGCLQALPSLGGLKAAEFQLQLGFGSPTVIPL